MLRPLVSLIALSLFFISSSAFADARGEMLFGQHCVACHQFGGKGGIGLPLTPEKMDNQGTRTHTLYWPVASL